MSSATKYSKVNENQPGGKMDYDERIAKVETLVETLKKDIDRLYGAIEHLRQHTDNGLAEMRQSLESHRKESGANMRWMIGLTLVNTSMIMGLGGRIFGLY